MNILIIDDEKTISDVLSAWILARGFQSTATISRKEGLEDKSTPTVVVYRIIESFKEPLMLGEHEADMKLSIGIATSKTTRTDADELVSQADEAMYAAKENGTA
jgi:GGDEF domain-containing protein